MKRLALLLLFAGLALLLCGWRWGWLRGYAWKGNLEYRPVVTEEIPRPFEQQFENYVTDQWPFVLVFGAALTVFAATWLFSCYRARRHRSIGYEEGMG
jgi:hypothetical protein